MDQVIETPAPVSVPARSYGRKRKIPVDDSISEIPAQKIPTDSSFLTAAPAHDRIDSHALVSGSPIQETIPSSPPPPATAMETAYDEQKKMRGGRGKRQNQQFNGSNSGHELKTTTSNNNDILPSAFDATAATADHADKIDGDVDGAVDDFEKPSVKLVISKKKGSIFKSRAIEGEAGESIKQKRHVYKHKWDDDLPEEEKGTAHDA